MTNYNFYLCEPNGRRIEPINGVSAFQSVKKLNDVSVFSLVLPGDLPENYLKVDRLIEVERAPQEGKLRRYDVGFMRSFLFYDDDELPLTRVVNYGPNYLLDGRIVAYAAGSAYSTKTDYADDMMKAIVKENLGGSATDTDRDLTGLNFSVDNDKSAAGSILKSFAWRNVLTTLRDIAEVSAEGGTDLYFNIDVQTLDAELLKFVFRTYINFPGVDHGSTSDDPVTFSPQNHNLTEASVEKDYSLERNYIYAGGQGEEANRVIVEVEDTAREKASQWNRREAFADARNETATNGVTAKANQELEAAGPEISVGGKLSDAPNSVYGVDWDLGDKVVVAYREFIFDAVVERVQLSYDAQSGDEEIVGSFRVL